ncbi:uncharacterized protein LOC62_06G008184 [Vanrija pseudolonga]|uniref:Myb-like domain-containing protein n=1 Tax=Vanrija pseudolonga TaxID=143232 RepID=A0AAF0YE15_9TREE|nr:hypothetical protein LOC62_06G008184 [Vanrija pseudolonga]
MPPTRHPSSPSLEVEPYAAPAEPSRASKTPATTAGNKDKRPWTAAEYLALFEHVTKHGATRFEDAVPGRTRNQCYKAFTSPSLDIKPYIVPEGTRSPAPEKTTDTAASKRGRGTAWSGPEYIALFDHAIKHGAGTFDGVVPGRTKSQCYKTIIAKPRGWTSDEYLALFDHVARHGPTRLEDAVPGRTKNQSYQAFVKVVAPTCRAALAAKGGGKVKSE